MPLLAIDPLEPDDLDVHLIDPPSKTGLLDPLVPLEKVEIVPLDPLIPLGPPEVGPPSPSEALDEFGVRFSRCDTSTDLPCWSKDRMWMTFEQAFLFDLHKEHEGCRCRVRYYTFKEFNDYLLLHGEELA